MCRGTDVVSTSCFCSLLLEDGIVDEADDSSVFAVLADDPDVEAEISTFMD